MEKLKRYARLLFFLFTLWGFSGRPSYASQIIWQQIKRPAGPMGFSSRISASVGDYLYDVDGLTSPGAQVKLISSQGTIRVATFADRKGVFRFYHLLSPRYPGMFCFFNRDRRGRSSPPLCLWPPPPDRQRHLQGILLPPSFSLSKPKLPGRPVYLTGLAIPQSRARVFAFRSIPFWQQWLNFVLAQELAKPVLVADNGSFRAKLDTGHGRVLVGVSYQQTSSPPSYNLHWQSLSWWQWLIQQLISFAAHLLHWFYYKFFRWPVFFAIQITIIAYSFWRLKHAR